MIDDVQIPTIANLFETLRADAMYDLVDVVDDTAFFRRTAAPAIHPYGEGRWEQGANARRSYRHLPPARRLLARARDLAGR